MVMWDVRFIMRNARPCARGLKRFMVGPSSQKHSDTNSLDFLIPRLCFAFAPADSSVFRMGSVGLHACSQ